MSKSTRDTVTRDLVREIVQVMFAATTGQSYSKEVDLHVGRRWRKLRLAAVRVPTTRKLRIRATPVPQVELGLYVEVTMILPGPTDTVIPVITEVYRDTAVPLRKDYEYPLKDHDGPLVVSRLIYDLIYDEYKEVI